MKTNEVVEIVRGRSRSQGSEFGVQGVRLPCGQLEIGTGRSDKRQEKVRFQYPSINRLLRVILRYPIPDIR